MTTQYLEENRWYIIIWDHGPLGDSYSLGHTCYGYFHTQYHENIGCCWECESVMSETQAFLARAEILDLMVRKNTVGAQACLRYGLGTACPGDTVIEL